MELNPLRKMLLPILVLLSILVVASTNIKKVYADNEDLTYTISVKPVDNQIDKTATYYDLLVTPGQKQELTVVVSNTGKETKQLNVTPTNAITNQNGVIDYSRQADDYEYDSGLKYPFTSLVGKSQTVEVPAGEQKEVKFELNVPTETFTGEILGGFLVDVVDNDEKTDDSSQEGVKIVNKFQLVKAVMLRENEDKVTPELILNDVKPALVSSRTAVTANLQNTEPTMFGDLKVEAKVTKKGKTEVLKEVTKSDMEMAPNSNFDFPIMWGNERLKAGEYALSLVATSGDKKWEFTKNFTITAEESDKINKEAVGLEDEKQLYWLYIIIIVLVLLIIGLIIFLVVRERKKKKAKAQKSKKRKNKQSTLKIKTKTKVKSKKD